MEQNNIKGFLAPYGEIVLENETVGSYLSEVNGTYSLCIADERDVYYQKENFETALGVIRSALELRDKLYPVKWTPAV